MTVSRVGRRAVASVAEMGRSSAAPLRRVMERLAGRGIGDFTEDGGAAGAGGVGEIAGA